MAIDWEYYLDAEGDELQDAYDRAVEEAEAAAMLPEPRPEEAECRPS